MAKELELKAKVSSFDKVLAKLSKEGAEFLEERFERDIFFDVAGAKLKKNDSCLRLRIDKAGRRQDVYLTFKGPKEKTEIKIREEINVEVGDAESAEKLLLALGYKKVFVLEKKRAAWKVKECEVSLDELPLLGTFVEIEGPTCEAITQVQRIAGLDESKHITQSYVALAEQELASRQSDRKDVLFQWAKSNG